MERREIGKSKGLKKGNQKLRRSSLAQTMAPQLSPHEPELELPSRSLCRASFVQGQRMQVDDSAIGVLFAFFCLLTSNSLLVLIRGMNRSLRWGGKAFSFFVVVTVVLLMPDACKSGHGVDRNVVSSKASARPGPGLGLRLEGTKVGVDVQLSCLFPCQHAVLDAAQALQDPE